MQGVAELVEEGADRFEGEQGRFAVGGWGMLSVFSTTGRVPSKCDCVTKEFIQAPPRLLSRA